MSETTQQQPLLSAVVTYQWHAAKADKRHQRNETVPDGIDTLRTSHIQLRVVDDVQVSDAVKWAA